MLSDEPIPQPAGSLDPPRRQPPTAVATLTPEPPPMHRRGYHGPARTGLLGTLRSLILKGMDVADDLAAVLTGRR
jgi:hypothetical protein